MSALDDMLEANRRYAVEFEPGYRPQPVLAIVACMDARIDPPRALGLTYGTAHIIRNAGGRVAEALRSLAISQAVLGTREVAIIHHTECGMQAPAETIRERIAAGLGHEVDPSLPLLAFSDLAESVREDLAIYRTSPLVRHDIPVRGFIYDVVTRRLSEVDG
jgi:carbonic anhydrase